MANGNGTVRKAVIWFAGLLVAGVVGWIGTETWSNAKAMPLLDERLSAAEKHDIVDDALIGGIGSTVGEIKDSLLLLTFRVNLMTVELADVNAKQESTLAYLRKQSEQMNRVLGRLNLDDFGYRPDSSQTWGSIFIPSPPNHGR